MDRYLVILLVVSCLSVGLEHAILSKATFNPRENVWVTLGRAINTTTFCASLSTPSVPFVTCLIGVPLKDSDWNMLRLVFQGHCKFNRSCVGGLQGQNMSQWFEKYDNWDDHLPVGPEPQEIELVDSLNASYCVFLNASKYPCNEGSRYPCNATTETFVYPQGNKTDWQGWCQTISRKESCPTPGTTWPRKLPPGLFFICGNRAWQGIPFRPTGGPCTIGRLSMALPHHHPNKSNPVRWKREVTTILDNTCDDNVQLWNKWETILASLFTPGVSAARAHKNLETLSCWVVKQANLTSRVLSDLTNVMDNVQHAVLQNRMAVDFLLLAHGHGCDDFEGMCCMDLEDKSKSIHKEIKQLMDHSQKIKKDIGLFGFEGLTNWFGLGGWLKGLLQSILMLVVITVVVAICLSCAISCIKKMLARTVNQIMLVQKQKGEIVGEWLREKGHGSSDPLCQESLF